MGVLPRVHVGQVQDADPGRRSADRLLPECRRTIMKKFLKWTAIVVLVLVVIAFGCFLYLIPPFFVMAPETFGNQMMDAPPPVTDIADPKERAIAERGL